MDFVNKCFKGHSFRKYFLKIFYGKVKEQPIFLTIFYIFFIKVVSKLRQTMRICRVVYQ